MSRFWAFSLFLFSLILLASCKQEPAGKAKNAEPEYLALPAVKMTGGTAGTPSSLLSSIYEA